MTEDRQPYPSFCPADFELAESAAKTALQLAQKAAATDPTSLVTTSATYHLVSLLLVPLWIKSLISTTDQLFAQVERKAASPLYCWTCSTGISTQLCSPAIPSQHRLLDVLQASQQDLAFAEAASQRFAAGSALGTARTAAEEEYAEALLDIGRTFNNTKALAIAAESYMNLSPWDYYAQVRAHFGCLS